MTQAAAEADRRIGNLVTIGVVTAVDNATARVRVRIGDLDSPPLQVMQFRSGAIKFHWMPSVGEQVSVTAPSGDMARAFVGGSLPIDGNAIAPDAGSPTMDLGGGTMRVIGKLYVDGDVQITGKIDVTGPVTCGADVTASGTSLKTHKHGGVSVGALQTGVPV
jgi:phage baseplate assembly protein gpV